MGFFDAYELRARLAPTVIVVSPLVLAVIALVEPVTSSVLASSAVGLVLATFLYAYSFLVRHFGRRVESALWQAWGGPPSATILTHDDPTFPQTTKTEVRKALSQVLEVDLPVHSANYAQVTPAIQEAFRLVRQYLRHHDPKGVWSIHNAEYGFLRNLVGSSGLWAVNALIAAVGCGMISWSARRHLSVLFTFLNLLLAAVALVARKWILPSAVKAVAHRYAESAWLCFLAAARSGPGHERRA